MQSSYMSTKGTLRKGGVKNSIEKWYIIVTLPLPPAHTQSELAEVGPLHSPSPEQPGPHIPMGWMCCRVRGWPKCSPLSLLLHSEQRITCLDGAGKEPHQCSHAALLIDHVAEVGVNGQLSAGTPPS